MPEYGFSVTHILPDKYRMKDSVNTWENTGQGKTVFWHILRSDNFFSGIFKYYGPERSKIIIDFIDYEYLLEIFTCM